LSAFSEHFIKTGIFSQELFSKINDAFDERQEADYGFEISKTKDEAKEVLNYAEEFTKEVVSYLNQWIKENRSHG